VNIQIHADPQTPGSLRSSNLPPSNIFQRGHKKPLAEINRNLLQAAAPHASDWLALCRLFFAGRREPEAHWMSLDMLNRFRPLDGLRLFFEDDRIMPTPRRSLNEPCAGIVSSVAIVSAGCCCYDR